MINNKRIIVSLTSWNKRIGNVSKVVYSLLKQTVNPDSIEVNLSTEEFPNKENDLPYDLVAMLNEGLIQINWVEKNTGVFKKFIPVLQKYYGEDYYLFTVDDDWYYEDKYIETMLTELNDNYVYCPQKVIIGNRTIYRSKIFNEEFWLKLTGEIIETGVDDTYITYYLIKHKIKQKLVFNQKIKDMIKTFNEVEPLHNYYNKNNRILIAEKLARKIWL